MYVCIFIKLHITAQSGLVILSFYATRVDPPKGGSMILVTKTSDPTQQRGHTLSTCTNLVCMYVCMYVFIKLHLTTQSGPVILVILCHSH